LTWTLAAGHHLYYSSGIDLEAEKSVLSRASMTPDVILYMDNWGKIWKKDLFILFKKYLQLGGDCR
jgi:hypothetical protein